MTSPSLRTLVSAIGLTIALATAILAPLTFLLDAYSDTTRTLQFKAGLGSNRVAQYIYSHNSLWQYQQLRLAELIELPFADEEPIQQRILTADQQLVLEVGASPRAPIITRRVPIAVSGTLRGHLEVATSFRTQLYQAGLVTILSSLLGFGMYFALRIFPLRVLDQTIGALEESRERLSTQNERLGISETQLLNALQMARAGNWEYDVPNDLFTFNDNFYLIFHTTAEAVGGYTMSSAEYARRFVHPVEYEVVGAKVRAAIETKDPHFSQEFEHRMIYADGKPGYIAVRFFIVKDENGRTVGTYGVNQDITERKQVQLALADSKQKLDAALANMSQGLCMFDTDERLVIFNPRFAEIYGLSLQDIKPGMTTMELMALAHSRAKLANGERESTLELLQRKRVVEGKAGSAIERLADGRSIAVTQRPAPEGGFVATFEDITERQKAEKEIEYMARHDALTGLLNRSSFYERMGAVLGSLPHGETVAVLSLDLDHFKNVNDSLGHPVGDLLLRAAADRMRNCVRREDIVARLGGDEFAIVLVPLEEPADVTGIAARLIEALGTPFELEGHQVVVASSVGISLAPNDGNLPDLLMRNADLALYRAKADGGGVFRFFELGMDARMQARRALELDLRKAIVNHEFELYYQPIIDVKSGEVTSCEALVRWHHPERGMISPMDFIPVAEETGLIVPLGEWVLQQACAEAAKWPIGITIAVNLSPAQFKSKNLVPAVTSALVSSGLPASRLELEITELVLLQDNESAFAILHQLRDLGIKIAMDDFGTGYSSLGYLRSFPFDKIKIDQSFIQDLPGKEESLAIVRAVVGLSSSLGITTTAEGVETHEQLASVTSEGCTEFQGYLFSKPRTAEDVSKVLSDQAKRAETVTS
ncbi:MAG TPA: hypothetical protein DIC56_08875 [Rhizobium sp.]|nr:hypothetical protein [Rhizobium sp.]